jgi:hypothetical protein
MEILVVSELAFPGFTQIKQFNPSNSLFFHSNARQFYSSRQELNIWVKYSMCYYEIH